MASNAISERRKQTRARKVARQKPQAVFLVVHRLDYSVYFKRIEAEAFLFLHALREGKTLSAAAVLAFQAPDTPESKLLGIAQSWFASWSSSGWFCPPQSPHT